MMDVDADDLLAASNVEARSASGSARTSGRGTPTPPTGARVRMAYRLESLRYLCFDGSKV
jgi:hypothetical protein